jgi:hypothetical protein
MRWLARWRSAGGNSVGRLGDEGTSFRAILDGVRREFACALLRIEA